MKKFLINALALFGGLILGSVVNMGLIMVGGIVIPPPTGVDVSSMEALAEAMHLFQPQHFLFPFLAHALGTLVGALFAAKIAISNKVVFSILVSLFFLAGGIANVIILPSPLWFSALDLVGAYLPMGLLAYRLYLHYENKKNKSA